MEVIIYIILFLVIVFNLIILIKQNHDIKKCLNGIDKKIIIGNYDE